jgi:hypothetical protein
MQALSELFFSDRIFGMHPELSANVFQALQQVEVRSLFSVFSRNDLSSLTPYLFFFLIACAVFVFSQIY